MMDAYPTRATSPEVQFHPVLLTGAGAAAPTKTQGGNGLTVSRTSAGLYKLTWSESPGTFVVMVHGLSADTPSALASFSLVRDTWDAATNSIEIRLTNSTDVATDLAAAQYLDLLFVFKRSSV